MLSLIGASGAAFAQERTNPNKQSEELGKVSWFRNYEAALKAADRSGKPVLMLFQEVPGCATCRNYGHHVLTHPLMVDAIEHEFVPLVIYNNRGGADKMVLTAYREPAWNNPVVRIVDASGKDLVNRVAGNYSATGLLDAMEAALFKARKPVPGYLQVLGDELRAASGGNVKTACYKMYCFWSGEGHFGKLPGVVATEPGFMGGSEVVKVSYDANRTSASKLSQHGAEAGCTPIRQDASYRPDRDPQYYLKQSAFKYLPLTPLQKSRINSAIGKREHPERFLSPTQQQWLLAVRQGRNAKVRYDKPFEQAWQEMKP